MHDLEQYKALRTALLQVRQGQTHLRRLGLVDWLGRRDYGVSGMLISSMQYCDCTQWQSSIFGRCTKCGGCVW